MHLKLHRKMPRYFRLIFQITHEIVENVIHPHNPNGMHIVWLDSQISQKRLLT